MPRIGLRDGEFLREVRMMKHIAIALATILVLMTLTGPVLNSTGQEPVSRFPTRDEGTQQEISDCLEGSILGSIDYKIGEGDWSDSYDTISNSGDVNGDGYDDLIISAFRSSSGGHIFIFFGSSAFPMDMDVADADASFISEDIDGDAGTSVSIAGDVNGDGYDDILIGDPEYGTEGRAYLIFGKASQDWDVEVSLSEDRIFQYSVVGFGSEHPNPLMRSDPFPQF